MCLDKLQEPALFWTILFFANIAMFLCTIAISRIWSSFYQLKTIPLLKKDLVLAISIMMINVIVAIPGYLLFLHSKIAFTQENMIRDLIVVFFLVDLVMYLLHYVSHAIWPFKLIHRKHHMHTDFNSISLYVMQPIETLLFGLLLTVIPFAYSFNIYSFVVFLFINWLLGVIAHLNTLSSKPAILFGNNIFHKSHHEFYRYNYGFYTVIWDKLFGTYYKNVDKESNNNKDAG